MAATDGQANDGPPLTELESLQLKANQVTDESLESTRRMISLCEDVSKIFVQITDHTYRMLMVVHGEMKANCSVWQQCRIS